MLEKMLFGLFIHPRVEKEGGVADGSEKSPDTSKTDTERGSGSKPVREQGKIGWTITICRRSLLYLVSNAFEHQRGVPILGMEKLFFRTATENRRTSYARPSMGLDRLSDRNKCSGSEQK
jgi:hypothetical protein